MVFSPKKLLIASILLVGLLILAKYLNEYTPVYRFPHHIPRKDLNAPREINGVPLVIYQSWGTHEIPKYMKENIESVLEKNPEFEYYLYSDEECRMFIQHNFDADVLAAFDSLRPGAYKSDLWRYCILYVKGGVYMDIKMKPLIPLRNFIQAQPYVFVKDRVIDSTRRDCMWNGFLIAPPKFEIFKFCIEEIIESCKRHDYKENPFDITGPCLLGRMIKKHEPNNYLKYNLLTFSGPTKIYWNTDIIMKEYKEYREEQKQFARTNHYGELWRSRHVYHE